MAIRVDLVKTASAIQFSLVLFRIISRKIKLTYLASTTTSLSFGEIIGQTIKLFLTIYGQISSKKQKRSGSIFYSIIISTDETTLAVEVLQVNRNHFGGESSTGKQKPLWW